MARRSSPLFPASGEEGIRVAALNPNNGRRRNGYPLAADATGAMCAKAASTEAGSAVPAVEPMVVEAVGPTVGR
jgi:hypothetical protein